MESIKIKIPKGFEVENFNEKTGEIKFKESPKDVKSKIKTIEDVLEANGLTQKEFDKSCNGLEEDEAAYRLVKLIAKALNKGWEPDWDNSSQYKYFPWFYMGSSAFRSCDYANWLSGSNVGSRLCFKSRELAEYAGKQFEDVYKQFMLIK